jgi:Mg-chelatase subunit ChlD/uncharacterized membrane protein
MPESLSSLELTDPLFLVGLVALPALAYYGYRTLVDFARWQRLLSLFCRTLIVVLLVLASAGLTLLAPTREPFIVFAIDRSKSISEEARRQSEQFVDQALRVAGNHRSAFVYFAAEPRSVQSDRRAEIGPLDDMGTNLAAAIEVAAGSIPPSYVPHIVLLSDGNETTGDALQAAARAGVPISTVSLPSPPDPEVQVSSVNVPPQVREGEPFDIEVVLDSNHADEGVVELYRGPFQVADLQHPDGHYKIVKGETRIKFRDTLTQGGLAIYKARIRAFQDQRLENNDNIGLVYALGKPRVLLLDSDPFQAKKHLVPALEQEGIQVEVRLPRGMPDSLSELQNYEMLILSNVPATALTQQKMEIAKFYVQELGGGLLMLGGEQSFGLGGYSKTVLEDILPVRSEFEREKEKPALAMVLLIDRSGSMEGQKMELAKEAAKSAVALLGPSDKIGVIAFDVASTWISELRPASDRAYVMDQISRIQANGGTHISPAMEMAYEALRTVPAKYKHVILLTDGEPNPTDHGDFQGIAASMALARITLSTVGVGADADKKFLEELATIGKGRFYFTDDPTSIPQIFAKETITASQSAINERPFVPIQVQHTPVLANLDFASAPELHGYVLTRPKEASELILATEKGDPLLAWGRFGLGMSVAFTSDASTRWAGEWISNWPDGYSKFWSQILRHAMRKNEAKGIQIQVEQNGRQAKVILDAMDVAGRFLNQAETKLAVIGPHLVPQDVPVTQVAPGRYVAEFGTPDSGPYHLELSQKQAGNVVYHQARGLAVGYPEELRLRPPNDALLQALARISGGIAQPAPDAVFDVGDRVARRAVPLWPYLVMAAGVLFVLDVALRRIDFSVTVSRWRTRSAVALRPGPVMIRNAKAASRS